MFAVACGGSYSSTVPTRVTGAGADAAHVIVGWVFLWAHPRLRMTSFT
jgi:hypothetical protein